MRELYPLLDEPERMQDWLSRSGLPEKKGALVLMCAGQFTPMEILCDLDQGDVLAAVDNGLAYLEEMGRLPDLILGDFDSIGGTSQETLRSFDHALPERVLHLPVMKDDPDTMAAIRFAAAAGFSRVRLYGACGGRMDHMMANLAAAVWARKHGVFCYFINAGDMMFVLGPGDEKTFHPEAAGMFSVFSLSDRCEGVTIRGMHYTMENGTLTNDFPLGQSNEIGPRFLRAGGGGIQVEQVGEDRFAHNGSMSDSEAYRLGLPGTECSGETQETRASIRIRTGYALAIFTYEVEKKSREF